MATHSSSIAKARQKVKEIRATLPHQKPETAKQVLENAIALLKRKGGWTRHVELNYEIGSVCAIGALYVGDSARATYASAGGSASFSPPSRGAKALKEAVEAVRSSLPGGYGSITGWNDGYAKDKRAVISLFQRAIKRLDE